MFGTQVQSVPRFFTMEFIIPTRSRCGKKFNTDTDRFVMHAQINLDAYDDHVGCLALGFTLCFDFVCMEFTVPVGHRCGQKFNTDSDEFEMHAQMSWGAHEVHAGCFVFDSVLCPIFIRMEFIVPIETVVDKSSPATHTDSKCMHK